MCLHKVTFKVWGLGVNIRLHGLLVGLETGMETFRETLASLILGSRIQQIVIVFTWLGSSQTDSAVCIYTAKEISTVITLMTKFLRIPNKIVRITNNFLRNTIEFVCTL